MRPARRCTPQDVDRSADGCPAMAVCPRRLTVQSMAVARRPGRHRRDGAAHPRRHGLRRCRGSAAGDGPLRDDRSPARLRRVRSVPHSGPRTGLALAPIIAASILPLALGRRRPRGRTCGTARDHGRRDPPAGRHSAPGLRDGSAVQTHSRRVPQRGRAARDRVAGAEAARLLDRIAVASAGRRVDRAEASRRARSKRLRWHSASARSSSSSCSDWLRSPVPGVLVVVVVATAITAIFGLSGSFRSSERCRRACRHPRSAGSRGRTSLRSRFLRRASHSSRSPTARCCRAPSPRVVARAVAATRRCRGSGSRTSPAASSAAFPCQPPPRAPPSPSRRARARS